MLKFNILTAVNKKSNDLKDHARKKNYLHEQLFNKSKTKISLLKNFQDLKIPRFESNFNLFHFYCYSVDK